MKNNNKKFISEMKALKDEVYALIEDVEQPERIAELDDEYTEKLIQIIVHYTGKDIEEVRAEY